MNPLSNYKTQREEVRGQVLSSVALVLKPPTEGGGGGVTPLSLAHWIVCSMTAGKDFRVQNGISSSGGSL